MLTGARAVIKIDGIPVSVGQNIVFNHNMHVIGDIHIGKWPHSQILDEVYVYDHPHEVVPGEKHKVLIQGHQFIKYLDFAKMVAFTIVEGKARYRRLEVEHSQKIVTVLGTRVSVFSYGIYDAYEKYIASLVVE